MLFTQVFLAWYWWMIKLTIVVLWIQFIFFFLIVLYIICIGISHSNATRSNCSSFSTIGVHTKCTNNSIASMCPSIFQWTKRKCESTTSEWKRDATIIQFHWTRYCTIKNQKNIQKKLNVNKFLLFDWQNWLFSQA